MRNVYVYIGLFILFGINCFGQLQNANWYFGNHAGLSFNSGTPVELSDMPTNTNFYTGQRLEAVASVSDKNGNLLFYSNATEIYSNNHLVMQNGTGLNGHPINAQGVIIIPRPGHNKQFYVITRDGGRATSKGLYYSVVDMNQNSGLGAVTIKNIVLKDHLGNDINASYNYAGHPNHEKLTSALNSDGINYWMVTQVKNYIYSYKVTSTGIDLVPVSYYTFITEQPFIGASYIRISPNGKRIVTSRHITDGSNVYYLAGSFNSLTGEITNMTTAIIPQSVPPGGGGREMEFSPDSNNLYYISLTSSAIGLHKYNFVSGQTAVMLPNLSQGFTMRLGIDNKIYIPGGTGYTFSVINNPNNYTNPQYAHLSLTISRDNKVGLPQWVYWQDNLPCESLTLTTEPNTNFIYNNKSNITAHVNYNLTVGTDIEMHARDFIALEPNVHITSGALYWARIQDCEGGDPIEMRQGMSAIDKVKNTKSTLFSMYPNPAHDRVTLTADAGITSITITSLDGMLMYSTKLSGKETVHDVDVSRYRKGLYIVNLITADGKTESQKLMKD